MKKYSIALSAGEASGDLHGSNLVRELTNRLEPGTSFWGGGGERMNQAGVNLVVNTSGGGTIGVFETLASLPGVFAKYHRLRKELISKKPDLFIPIDFGAFNIRLARIAFENGIDVVYYIPPGSWRHTVKGADGLKACGGKVVTPFPWSFEGLKAQGIDVRWPGHPLLDIVKPTCTKQEFCKQNGLGGTIVGLFPGSRTHEIGSHLIPLLKSADIMSREIANICFVMGAASNSSALQSRIDAYLRTLGSQAKVVVLENRTYDCMAFSDVAVVTSGTATLEAAILDTPMVIIYRGSPIMRFEFLFRKGVIESFIGLPNIIAGSMIAPEMLGAEVTGESLAAMALSILNDKNWQQSMKSDYAKVRELLGGKGSLGRAAEAVIELAGLERR